MIEMEREFWFEHVVKKVAPDPDFQHPSTLSLVRSMYGVDPEKNVELNAGLAGLLVSDYDEAKKLVKEAERKRDEIKARMLALLGEASSGTIGDEFVLTRKEVTRKAYEVRESTYVDFRVKKLKGKT
jgi:predicted phage-related endonuclease